MVKIKIKPLDKIGAGVGILNFFFGLFVGRFFGFCTDKRRIFVFGVRCGLQFFRSLAPGFAVLAKI